MQGSRQGWLICGFKDHDLKLKFDAGAAEIMARVLDLVEPESNPLPTWRW